jgi:hypothetical protein
MSTKSVVTLGLICLVAAIAATPASAYSIRYQNWSQVPDNSAGVVFHPSTDNFEAWDNQREGVRATIQWNYKGVKDRWKYLYVEDGAHQTFNLNLSEKHHVYFLITAIGGPSYVSEFRTNGDEP